MSLQCLSKISSTCFTLNSIVSKTSRVALYPVRCQFGSQQLPSCTGCGQTKVPDRCAASRRQSLPNLPSCSLANHSTDLLNTPKLQYSTIANNDKSMFARMWQGLGFTGKLQYKKFILQNAGLRLYLCCVELIDYPTFFEVLQLPDTFNSWFRITELHVWMAMVRVAQDGTEGKLVRNSMVRSMWDDVEKRSKKLGTHVSASQRKEGINILSEQFRSALMAYDEGLMDDDRVLAGAIWRNLLDMKCDDPQKLEIMVQYIRMQISHLEQQESGVILTSGLAQFVPLQGDEDRQRNKQILQEILKRI